MGSDGISGVRGARWFGQQEIVELIKGTQWENAQVLQQCNGYMTDKIYMHWLEHMVLPATHTMRVTNGERLCMLLDNFGAHVTDAAVKMCAENNIELVGLAPHSSNKTAPLDLGIKGSLKASLDQSKCAFRIQVRSRRSECVHLHMIQTVRKKPTFEVHVC